MRRVLTISFVLGVVISAVLAGVWTLINSGTLGHFDAMSLYPLQVLTTFVWPTSFWLMVVGPKTPMSSVLVLTAIALVVNGALYALIACVAFKAFHISPSKG